MAHTTPATYATPSTPRRRAALASGWLDPPPALRTTAVGTAAASAKSVPTADQAATRGRASRRRMIAIWTIHVPGEKT
jgi:hypothetical protein